MIKQFAALHTQQGGSRTGGRSVSFYFSRGTMNWKPVGRGINTCPGSRWIIPLCKPHSDFLTQLKTASGQMAELTAEFSSLYVLSLHRRTLIMQTLTVAWDSKHSRSLLYYRGNRYSHSLAIIKGPSLISSRSTLPQ